jgi:hypothetical protein
MSSQTPELKDLLQKYADTCITLDVCRRALKCGVASSTIEAAAHGFEKDKANLESQIMELFGQAEKRGAEVERAIIRQIVINKGIGNGHMETCGWLVGAIDARNTESGEGK